MSSTVEDFIEHYGMRGMRWGVRKPPKPDRRPSSDYKKSAPLRGQPVSTLTNKHLKSLNERMNMEQNYQRMNPSNVKKGASAIKGIIGALGTAASLYALTQSPAGKAAIDAGKKFINK